MAAANYWAKLFIDMLDDRKTASLPDSSWRRFVECILLAKELDENGYLPPVIDMAWRLRVDAESLDDDLTRLAMAGLMERREGDLWFVINFDKRQGGMSDAERSARYRGSKRKNILDDNENVVDENANTVDASQGCHDVVTECVTDASQSVTQNREEKRREEERRTRAPATTTPRRPPEGLPPSPLAKSQSGVRTPAAGTTGGSAPDGGMRRPTERQRPPKREPTPDEVAIGEMANALTDVTGVSARLNWAEVGGLAGDLVAAGYTADQVRGHYGRESPPGWWNWYSDYWLGKEPRAERPSLRGVRETIAGATVPPAAAATKTRVDPILQALAMAGPFVSQEAS